MSLLVQFVSKLKHWLNSFHKLFLKAHNEKWEGKTIKKAKCDFVLHLKIKAEFRNIEVNHGRFLKNENSGKYWNEAYCAQRSGNVVHRNVLTYRFH